MLGHIALEWTKQSLSHTNKVATVNCIIFSLSLRIWKINPKTIIFLKEKSSMSKKCKLILAFLISSSYLSKFNLL